MVVRILNVLIILKHITVGLNSVGFIPVEFLCLEQFYLLISSNTGINCTLANLTYSLLKIPGRNV